jgi:Tfp pilus assembly protein PilF
MEDGLNCMLRGDHDEAVRRFGAVLKEDPQFAEAYNKRATAHFLNGVCVCVCVWPGPG